MTAVTIYNNKNKFYIDIVTLLYSTVPTRHEIQFATKKHPYFLNLKNFAKKVIINRKNTLHCEINTFIFSLRILN